MEPLDCDVLTTREVNRALGALRSGQRAEVARPGGRHNLAVGLVEPVSVEIQGNAGYFTGGLCGSRGGDGPEITVQGFVGWSVGENLMSGTIRVQGSASQSAGASAHGGLVVIEGDASLRAGISLKGGTIAIAGDAGPMCGFMAQAGTILIGGDAGHGIGDSLFEAVIYVGGSVGALGADAREEELTDDDVLEIKRLVDRTGFDHIDPSTCRRIGSARQLYHFSTHHHGSY